MEASIYYVRAFFGGGPPEHCSDFCSKNLKIQWAHDSGEDHSQGAISRCMHITVSTDVVVVVRVMYTLWKHIPLG